MSEPEASIGGFPNWSAMSFGQDPREGWALTGTEAMSMHFKARGCSVVWLPWGYCPDVARQMSGRFEVRRYGGAAFSPDLSMAAPGDGAVVYIPMGLTALASLPDPRGLRRAGVVALLDLAHDLHRRRSMMEAGWACVASHRKFLPVPFGAELLDPEGGALAAQRSIRPGLDLGLESLSKLVQDRPSGYASFKALEEALGAGGACPAWCVGLIKSIDEERLGRERARAFAKLHAALGAANRFGQACGVELGPEAGAPIAYPFLPEGAGPADLDRWRARWAARGIFVAKYWEGMDPRGRAQAPDALALPLGPMLSDSQVGQVAEAALELRPGS